MTCSHYALSECNYAQITVWFLLSWLMAFPLAYVLVQREMESGRSAGALR